MVLSYYTTILPHTTLLVIQSIIPILLLYKILYQQPLPLLYLSAQPFRLGRNKFCEYMNRQFFFCWTLLLSANNSISYYVFQLLGFFIILSINIEILNIDLNNLEDIQFCRTIKNQELWLLKIFQDFARKFKFFLQIVNYNNLFFEYTIKNFFW